MAITRMMARRRYPLVAAALLASGLPAGGCGRGLFGISSAENRDASIGEVNSNPVPEGLSVCFPDHPTSCDETCRQATRVLWENCAKCHGDPNTAHGLPPWDFVMDPQSLTTRTYQREGQPPIHFVLPGDPAHSAIYLRAVINKDMPPRYPADLPSPPRVSDSDGQILHDWIAGCLGADPVDAGSPASPDARTDGYPVETGNSNTPTVEPCPASPPAGACRIDRALCLYRDETCVCASGTWECLPCPGQQPAIGSRCPTTTAANGDSPLYRCGYGTINCSCTDGSNGPVWECGACPSAHPAEGAACGSASFSCVYGSETCKCSGSWSCTEPYCPSPISGLPWFSCAGSGTYGCSYGEQLCGVMRTASGPAPALAPSPSTAKLACPPEGPASTAIERAGAPPPCSGSARSPAPRPGPPPATLVTPR